MDLQIYMQFPCVIYVVDFFDISWVSDIVLSPVNVLYILRWVFDIVLSPASVLYILRGCIPACVSLSHVCEHRRNSLMSALQ